MRVQLNQGWRVVICPANHQWVLEYQQGGRWRARSFFRTSEALLRVSMELAGDIDAEAWDKLKSLPTHFKVPTEALEGRQQPHL